MTCKDCKHCLNGWLNRGDVECVNGVLIDIDVAHEGWGSDVLYPPGPCNTCAYCDGTGFLDEHGTSCGNCNGTGWIGGVNRSQKLLNEWSNPEGASA